MATTPGAVYTAILGVMADLSKVGIRKSKENTQQKYMFRGIDQVLNALSPLLVKHGLVILPKMLTRTTERMSTRAGGTMFFTVLEAEFTFVSTADGSAHAVSVFGEAMDTADKSTNKAMSAAYKYAVIQAFCIPIEGQPDADQATHEVKAPKPAAAKPAQKAPSAAPAAPRSAPAAKAAPKATPKPSAAPGASADRRLASAVSTPAAPSARVITESQRRRLFSILTAAGRDRDAFKSWLKRTYGTDSTTAIKLHDYDGIVRFIESPAEFDIQVSDDDDLVDDGPLEREPGEEG